MGLRPENSFFGSLKPLLVFGRLIGTFPISGLLSNSPTELNFSWYSAWFFYSAFLFVSAFLINVILTIKVFEDGVRLDNFGSTIFYTVCNLNSIFFALFAREYPRMCLQVQKVEENMAHYGEIGAIGRKIKVYLGVFIVLAVVEHSLVTALNVMGAIKITENSNATFLEALFQNYFGSILTYTGHNDFLVILIFFVNVVNTFNWNFLDYFIACVCMQLASKLDQFNRQLCKTSLEKNEEKATWEKLCDDYNMLSILIKGVSGKFSKMVLMSYGSNLYHLSLQLLRSLRFHGDGYAMLYFYFSLSYLILRTLSVSFCCAQVHEMSQLPKEHLYALEDPSPAASRLLHQVITDDIHISAKGFFVVDRRFIMTMVATLITYEIILLQINSLRYGWNHRGLHFTWKSFQIAYTFALLLITVICNVASTYKNVSDGIRLDSFGWTMFYSVCNLNTIFFVSFARKLPALCRRVSDLEETLSPYGYPKNINQRTKLFLGGIFALSVFEHSLLTYLNVIAAVAESHQQNETFLRAFFNIRFPIILSYVGHNDWLCVFVFLLHVIETVNWNYLDFFLATISMQLSGKLRQLVISIKLVKQREDRYWRKLSYDYNQLSLLVKDIDKEVSKLVLMSYFSNIYHLSLQLIRSLKFKGNAYEMSYFYFSLGYLILRMMPVTLCGAQIREVSQLPKEHLYALEEPPPAAARLLHQVITDDIHLSGKGFFFLDNSFVTRMIGTLVAYEVILIQLNALKYNDPLNKTEAPPEPDT